MIPEPSPRLRPEPLPLDDPGRPDPPPALLIWLTVLAIVAVVVMAALGALDGSTPPQESIPGPAYTVLAPVTVTP